MNFKLTDSDRKLLREIQRNEYHKKNYVKVTVLLGLDKGNSVANLSDLLGIDDATLYRYVSYFKEKGLDDYLESNYVGFWGKLDSFQLAGLQNELALNFYTDSHQIVAWIAENYGISYTSEGLVPLLHRIGFSYKKTKQVPCEADRDKQIAFVGQFEQLSENLSENEAIFFVDAVHPQHNTRSSYGWIAKGKVREVLSVSGRNRVNLNGAFNVENPAQVVIREDETINAQSTWSLYEQIEAQCPDKEKIYVICDNARYYKNKALQEKLKNSRIKQIFLPPYSPNLNLIERLWKFMRKKVIDNNFIRNFKDFKAKLLEFFKDIDQYKDELKTLLAPKFHLPKSQNTFY